MKFQPRLALPRAACLAAALICPAAAPAASNRMKELMARARAEALTRPARVATAADPGDFGVNDDSTLAIDAYAFQGAQSAGDQFGDDGNGYRFLEATTSGGYIAAAVQLPSGVRIDNIGISVCSGTTGTLTLGLFDGGAFGDPITLVGSLTTGLLDMCYIQTVSIPGGFEHSANQEHPLYAVIHWEGPLDGTLKFNSIAVYYRRLVSPAPATATFNDVPTNHPFFQYVEALAASGITAGCGNGNFCPDQPLTRGQMAVFLSKALGLHWPL
jgi:hypothetical protein